MIKLEKLERRLKRYQKRYKKLLKSDKAASARYGNEFRDAQLRVLETAMVEIKKQIASLKRKRKSK